MKRKNSFKDQKPAEDTVMIISPSINKFPIQQVLQAPSYTLEQFDAGEIKNLVNKLQPDSVLVLLVSKEFEGA